VTSYYIDEVGESSAVRGSPVFVKVHGATNLCQENHITEKGTNVKKVKRNVEDIEWIPHPTAKRVTMKPLVTRKDHGADVSCILVLIPKDSEVPEHIHEREDDILYPLRGRATMWVDGSGSFPLEPGCVVRVPSGTKHRIENVSEDLLLYDVFWPALI
jgi:mannose-6-phosphate isomerase-like protein (cupin superfamily)